MKRYLIRLDDACPTMDKQKWKKLEAILDKHSIKPIVAVVPINQDPELMIDEPDSTFWANVRGWQDKGWNIALHGYNHVYTTDIGGMIPINNRSEFAGIGINDQRDKLKRGLEILKSNGLTPAIWVAPSHSFDNLTLEALKLETPIRIISDGFSYFPYTDKSFFWIPQQIWKLKEKEFGIWTCCFHPNMMQDSDFSNLDIFCTNHSRQFVDDINGLVQEYSSRKRSLRDRILYYYMMLKFRIAQSKYYSLIRGLI